MKSYNAIGMKSKNKVFSEFPISLKTGIAVHPNTHLSWIEEIDEDADKLETLWYETVVKNNLVKEVDV